MQSKGMLQVRESHACFRVRENHALEMCASSEGKAYFIAVDYSDDRHFKG